MTHELRPTRVYADEILGRTVVGATHGQWRVVERIPRNRPGHTGGHFSAGYIAEDSAGVRAYLKALDLSGAWLGPDPTRALESLLAAFNFERDLLSHCRDRKLDRVVVALDYGQIVVDPVIPSSVVPFLICELGDGDVRVLLRFSKSFDAAWAVRALHHTATGLMQLHANDIAHQDLKPSNVLVFQGGTEARVADLGRASRKGHASPHEHLTVAGDLSYAPPELLYGALDGDWRARRMGGDLYLLGSLVISLFSGVSMTGLLIHEMQPEHRWDRWRGTYTTVLPFLRDAFDKAVSAFAEQVPGELRTDIARIVKQLCDPDLSLRGHPRERAKRHGNPFSLERYVAEFDLIARRVERGMRAAVTVTPLAASKRASNR